MTTNRTSHILAALVTATLGTTLVAAPVAEAGPLKARQGAQDARIDQGVSSGELTGRERAALRGEQRAIDQARDRALANDGKIGNREAKRLTKAQNRASKDIHRAKHNARSKN